MKFPISRQKQNDNYSVQNKSKKDRKINKDSINRKQYNIVHLNLNASVISFIIKGLNPPFKGKILDQRKKFAYVLL